MDDADVVGGGEPLGDLLCEMTRLDRHIPVKAAVARAIDLSHGARAQLTDDLVRPEA
jgi:hypothetical protein